MLIPKLFKPGTQRARRCLAGIILLFAMPVQADWFSDFRASASDADLHRFLHAMPKGGDLHHHTTGSLHPEWLFDIAVAYAEQARFYTKVRINNCRYGSNEFGPNPYLLLFRTVSEHTLQTFDECERSEYVALDALDDAQRTAWMDALRLNAAHEGRAEFFEAHWARLGELLQNPHILLEAMVRNLAALAEEGLTYLEAMVPLQLVADDGTVVPDDEVAALFAERLAQPDVKALGITVRLQLAVLRFHPDAEEMLRRVYAFVARHPQFVAVNLVGREDNDKGYPLRFLPVLRELRAQYSGVRLSMHAGEVDAPNENIRDTLLLGAERIGHGLNLITDPDTMLRMRHGPYLVEINLISNLLLEYVSDYRQHPFPEYLRTGVPVALSTDDRGMWDSTLTDEFFVGVKEFALSWEEITLLSRNSLKYAFLPEAEKDRLLKRLEDRLQRFERRFRADPAALLASSTPQYRGFLCRRYAVCAPEENLE